MKKMIEEALMREDVKAALEAIKQYEQIHPQDFELLSYYISYYLLVGDADTAMQYAKKAVFLNPFDIEANYNYAVCAELEGNLGDAYAYYIRTKHFQNTYQTFVIEKMELESKVEELHAALIQEGLRSEIDYADARFEYAVRDPFWKSGVEVVGTTLMDTNQQMYFVGRYHSWYDAYFSAKANRDAFHTKCAILPVDSLSTSYQVEPQEGESLLVPIVLVPNFDNTVGNTICDREWDPEALYGDTAVCRYLYLPVEKKADFETVYPAIFCKPIPLKRKRTAGKKRLILNLFLDSFNKSVIEKYGWEQLMPHTKEFFKNGLECEQYYACSEYTCPSIATYWTGKQASSHMNLLNDFRWDFMEDQVNLMEYFKNAGYVTAKIGGNHSISPTGYMRGTDFFLYQFATEGMEAREIVMDTIDYLETFQETEQFVWLDFLDLHTVASGFLLSMNVQAQLPFEYRIEDNEWNTTIKQGRSINKEKRYLEEMREIDLCLSFLYQYLNEHYSDEEMIVTMFSDHGTSFMVDDEEPFMSWQRTNVPLLIRGNGLHGTCKEIIQTTDYAGMICHMSGVPYDYTGTDGNLPVFLGGTQERQFAFSQTLFVGDPYMAAFHGKNCHVYYKTKQVVQNAFRINIADSEIWAVDDTGMDITDQVDINEFKRITEKAISHLIIY